MATTIPAGTSVRASILATLYGDVNDIVNTVWFTSVGAGGTLEDLATGIRDDWCAPLRSSLITAFSFTGVNMVSYPPPAIFSLLFTQGFPLPGLNADTTSIPPASAYCVTWTTGFAGRANRGRDFIAGTAREFFNDGVLTPTSIATLEAIWSAILVDLGGIAGWEQVVAHTRIKNPSWQPNPLLTPFDRRRTLPAPTPTFRPVTNVSVRPVERQQRRREIGVSRHGARGGPSHIP